MKWFKDIFKRKKQMVTENLEVIKESLSKYSKYQWIKSERQGNVTEFKDVTFNNGIVWVEFMDGSRINHELLDEFMIKTNVDSELLEINDGLTDAINGPLTKTNVNSASIRETKETRLPGQKENPLYSLLKKQKPNIVDVDISIQMNIPSVDLYNVITESFDNAEEEIVNYIVSSLDIETIRKAVKNAIESHYHK